MSNEKSTAIVKNKNDQYTNVQQYLFSKEKVIANLVPKGSGLDPTRMIRLTLGMMNRQPELLECSPASLLLSILDSVHYGLEPNPVLGHAFIVPYWNKKKGTREATFQIGYKGLIVLAHRTGLILDIDAAVIHEKDKFKIQRHKVPQFVHEPAFVDDPGDPLGAYATALMRNGHQKFLPLTYAEIEKYRQRGQNKDGGPWQSDWDAMAKKTCIRRLCSMLPLDASHELATVIANERDAELSGHAVYANSRAAEIEAEDVAQLPSPKPRADELADRLAKKGNKGASAVVVEAKADPVRGSGGASGEEKPAEPDAVHGTDDPGF